MSETLRVTSTVPLQLIAQATVMRDRLAVSITEMVRDFEIQTSLRVMSFAVQRKDSKDRRGYKYKAISIGVIVALQGDGTDLL